MTYMVPEKDPITQAVLHIENERFPGTHCLWKEGQFCNIYVGFGVKSFDECFNHSPYVKLSLENDTIQHNLKKLIKIQKMLMNIMNLIQKKNLLFLSQILMKKIYFIFQIYLF